MVLIHLEIGAQLNIMLLPNTKKMLFHFVTNLVCSNQTELIKYG